MGVSKGVASGSQVVKALPVANTVNDWCHAGSSRIKLDSTEGRRQNEHTRGVVWQLKSLPEINTIVNKGTPTEKIGNQSEEQREGHPP